MGRKPQGRKPTKKSTPAMRKYWREQYHKKKKKIGGLVLFFIMCLSPLLPLAIVSANDRGFSSFLRFDGVDNYVLVSDDASLNMSGGDITIELWAKTGTSQSRGLLAKMDDNYGDYGWQISFVTGPSRVSFFINDGIGGDNELQYAYTYEDDSWHHYTFEFNNTDDSLWLWIDGVYKATLTENPTANYDTIGDLFIGVVADPDVEYSFEGDINEIRVYSRRLTQEEITYSFTNIEPQDETDLELWLRFKEGTGDTAYDETTNDNDGTLMPDYPSNAPEWFDIVLEISIANIDADAWVFEGKKRYEFTVDYMDVSLTDIQQVGVGFTDSRNQFHSIWYDRDANTLSVTSPDDGISGWLTTLEQSGNDVVATFQIMFNSPIPDTHSVTAYARIIDTDDSGWIDGSDWYAEFIFNIYNLGGLATLETSGWADRITGGDVFEVFAADSRTPILITTQDFDVRTRPLDPGRPEGWWGLVPAIAPASEESLIDDIPEWDIFLTERDINHTVLLTNRLPEDHAAGKTAFTSYPFSMRLYDNPPSAISNGFAEYTFRRPITSATDELAIVQWMWMTPADAGTMGMCSVTDNGFYPFWAFGVIGVKTAARVRFNGAGDLEAYDALGWVTLQAYSGYTWYNMTMALNVTSQTYDVYVDEVLRGDDIEFTVECPTLGNIGFYHGVSGANYTDFYVDDLEAHTDWSADYGGLVKSTMLFNKLQHWGMDFDFFVEEGSIYAQGPSATPDISSDDYSDYGYWEFGWDIMLDETWIEDFLVARVNITDGKITGKNNWVKYNVTWESQGEYVKNDMLYGLFEGYSLFPGDAKDTSGWYWDIWFNRANASTIIGARLNTEYYGMSDKSAWWAVWSSLWKPMRTEVSESTIFVDLEDVNGTIHSAKDVGMVRSWVKVLRTSEAEFAYKIQNIKGLDFLVAIDTMSGIDTPPIIDTQVPDVMSGFFGSALGGIFTAALKRLSNALAGFGMQFFTMSIEFIDNVFASLGYPALVSTIFGWMDSLFSYVPTLLSYGMTMIGQIFSLITVSAGDTLNQLTSIITIWVGMYNSMMYFLTSVFDPAFNLWNDLGVNSFIQIGAILYPLWLVMMFMDKGGQAVIDHLNGMLNIGSFFLNFILNVGGFFMGLLDMLIGAIRG